MTDMPSEEDGAEAMGLRPGESLYYVGPDGELIPIPILFLPSSVCLCPCCGPEACGPIALDYPAWGGCPGRDYAEPQSLTCLHRTSRRLRCESERPRRLRACVRAHPSDGPPAPLAAPGAPVIDP